jgi:hypothetical protein
MKRWIVMLLAAVAALAVGVGAAGARPSYPTTITRDGSVSLPGGRTLDSGHLTSTRGLCIHLAGRAVKLIGVFPDGTARLLDLSLTSANGAWATKADYRRAVRVKAKVLRIHLRLRGRRLVCRRAVVSWRAR